MAMTSLKNAALYGVSTDLGLPLGGQLQNQVKNETEEERKKRLKLLAERQQFGPASMDIFGMGGFGG